MAEGPVRTCAGCRKEQARARLIRVARGADGTVSVDPTGSAPGRGAYVCFDEACVERACRSGNLARALRVTGPVAAGVHEDLLKMTKGMHG
jgi:predicted RNA-binding protein YlxR (DUF448 family)